MKDEIELIAALPEDLSAEECEGFRKLVEHGGEVIGAALTANIANARVMVILRSGGIARGVAALKRPQKSYRDKIMKQAAVAFIADVPYELGYIFIEPAFQKRGLSHRLVSEALAHSDGEAVFATVRTDNSAMQAVLFKAGFTEVGQQYRGLKGRSIGLFVRNGT